MSQSAKYCVVPERLFLAIFYRPKPKLSLCLELPLSLQNQAILQTLKAALCCFFRF